MTRIDQIDISVVNPPSRARRIKFALRNTAAAALRPVARLQTLAGRYVAVLSYHRILPGFPAGSPRSASIEPAAFEAQLDYLASNDYKILSLDELKLVIDGKIRPQRRAVAITFDDGYADNLLVAHAIARRFGFAVNYFIPTGIIGMERWPYDWAPRTPQEEWHMARHPELWRPLTWAEVEWMRSEGAHFGCHGYLHRRFSELDRSALREEIARSVGTYRERMGEPPQFFSIPWGDAAAFTKDAIPILMEHGIQLVFTTLARRVALPHAGPLIPRISIREQDDLASFARKIEGAHDLLRRLAHPFNGGGA